MNISLTELVLAYFLTGLIISFLLINFDPNYRKMVLEQIYATLQFINRTFNKDKE